MPKNRLSLLTRLRRTRVYTPHMNKPLPKRLNWEQLETRSRQEGRKVVKGTSKRIIVVKSPDPKVFEQAFFIVREDFRGREGASSSDVLREAQKVADEYVKNSVSRTRRFLSGMPPAAFAVAGAALTGAVWVILNIVGI